MDNAGSVLIGDQRPRLYTAPPRHTAEAEGCRSCSDTDDGHRNVGCGDYISQEIIDWSFGYGYKMDDWQQWVLREACGTRADGRWASFENTLIVSRQNGKGAILEVRELSGLYVLGEELIIHTAHELKGLADNTPVLTHNRGWAVMGDLKEGDYVYAPDGTPARVSATAQHTDKDCYRITFADGQQVTADADHRWEVSEAALYNSRTELKVVTTRQMAEAGLIRTSGPSRASRARKVYRWRTAIAQPVQMPVARFLPVPPWVLGAWLGDGTSARGCLTVGAEDLGFMLEMIVSAGERVTSVSEGRPGVWTVRVEGLTSRLRELGVLGSKHIPLIYLEGSVRQRRELLAGIMDTDGTVSAHQLVVGMKNEQVMRSTLGLVRSLGYRATLSAHESGLNGRRCGLIHTVRFAPNGVSPFSLPRKTERIQNLRHNRSQYNAVVAIEAVPTIRTSCITVEHPSACYLAGEGFFVTHNTAQEHFRRIVATIENYPALSRRLKGKPRASHGEEAIELTAEPTIIFGSGRKRMRRKVSPRLRFLARSRGSARGFSCNTLIYDEAMILSSESVGASLPTMAAIPNSQLWFTGSAGLEDSDQLARSRRRIVDGSNTRFFGAEWSIRAHTATCPRDRVKGRPSNDYVYGCEEHDDRDVPESWAKANPAYGIRLSQEFTENELEAMTMLEFDRERNGVGQWPAEDESWKVVSEDLWSSLSLPEPGKMTTPVSFALDVDEDGNAATIAAAWGHKDGFTVIEVPRNCSRTGTYWVVERLQELADKYKPIAIVAPRSGPAAGLGDDLEKLWPKHHKFGSKLIRPGPADEAAAFAWFLQQCKDQNMPLRHLGSTRAANLWHAVGSAETRVVGDGGKTWSRRDSSTDITPATACNLAAWGYNKKRRSYDLLASVR